MQTTNEKLTTPLKTAGDQTPARTPMESEYVDDWSCKECGLTGISEAEDACPECDSTWVEQND